MKKFLLVTGLACLAFSSPAFSQKLGWAANGTPWSGGTGTWQDGGPSVWNTEAENFVPWTNGNFHAEFNPSPGTVTVSGGVTAGRIILKNAGGYVFQGDAITLTDFVAIEGNQFTGTNTINNNIILNQGGDAQIKVYDYDGTGATLVLNGQVSFSGGSNHTLYVVGETANDSIIFNGALGNDSTSGNTTLGFGRDFSANTNATYQMNAASSGFDSNDFVTVGRGNLLVGNGAALGGARVQLGDGVVGATDTSSLRSSNATTISSRIELVNGNAGATYQVGTTATGTTTYSGEINLYDGRNLTVDVADGGVVDFTNDINNTGGLIKNGAGTAILSRAAGNNFTGTTTVNAGTLLVNNTSGNGTGGNAVLVKNLARFGGNGHINNSGGGASTAITVESGGTFVAGLAAGQGFNIEGNLNLLDGSRIELVLGAGGTSSFLQKGWGGATWDIDNAVVFDLTFTGGAGVGFYDNVLILPGMGGDPTGSWTFANGIVGTFVWDGGNVDLNITAVPEPSTGLLMALGLGYVISRRHARKNA